MKVMRLQVHHVGACKDVDLDLSGHHLYIIGGRNGNGKTTNIKALLMALCGRSGIDKWPDIPLQKDEEEGFVKVSLSGDEEMQDDIGFTAELHFTRRRDGSIKEEFLLKDSDGEPAPEPRTLLQRLYSLRMFDPTAFDRLRPKEQRAELARLFPELDFAEVDKEIGRLYDKRTTVNRDAKSLKARVDAMPEDGDVPDEEVSVEKLMDELRRRRAINETNQELRGEVDHFTVGLAQLTEDSESIKRNADEKIAEAERRLAQLKEYRQLEGKKADEKVRSCEYGLKAATERCVGLKDEDVEEVERQIGDSQNVNERVRQKVARGTCQKELGGLLAESQQLSDKIKDCEDSKIKRLREAKLPVEGLGLDREGITFDGLPFEQAAKSKRFLVGCMIGMAGPKPKLPLLVCEHGDGLDWETLGEFDSMLKQNDWQAVIEVCSKSEHDDQKCQVVMVDGKARIKA